MNNKTEKLYVPPQMEILTIEIEQTILEGSNWMEQLGGENPEQDW